MSSPRPAEDPGFVCKVCAFAVWLPIAELAASTVGLYDDHRFPGRCLVVLRHHVEHLTDLTDDEAHAFLRDVRMAGRALREATDGARINNAVLGNTVPHLHAHLIPRVSGGDPIPDRPPWEHPDARQPMTAPAIETWRGAIRSRLQDAPATG